MTDTEVRGMRRRGKLLFAAIALATASCAAVTPRSSPTRVLWVRGDHVYVALGDGAPAAPGDSVRFGDRGTPVGSGTVIEVVRDEMAIVALTSGSLARVKKLERVRAVIAHAPGAVPASLRVALPSGDRGNLLFRCPDRPPGVPRLPEGLRGYVLNEAQRSERPIRLRPDPHVRPPSPWPDTLIVHYFENATDEEIALERGDVDVAVFWPGELSRRMREDARWKDSPRGVRSRGIVAITGADLVPAGLDSSTALALDDELFRGDLEWTGFFLPPSERGPGQLGIDESLPGAATLRAWLTRRLGTPRGGVVGRMAYVDAPFDSAAAPGFQPLYRITCPVVSGPAWRRTVEAIGAGVFVNMAVCAPAAAGGR
ncbi:MAG TPA: hypothetical protein VE326_05735 [Candidatus Binatia bacterium]|nr:hypothetical protein [Candidatus Binatia bacterium]